MPFQPDREEEIFESLEIPRTGYAIFDKDDVLIYHNEQYRYVYLTFQFVDQLIGMRFEDIIRLKLENGEIAGDLAVSDPEAWVAWRLEQHGRERNRFEQRLADGRWMEVKERRTPSGGVVAQWTDITTAKKNELRLEDAIECTVDGFAILDQAGRVTLFNQPFAKRLGIEGHPVHGSQPIADIWRHLGNSGAIVLDVSVEEWVQERLKGLRQGDAQYVLEFSDETFILVREHHSRDGGLAMALSDVTELKNNERELVFRGKSLERALAEIDMAKQVLEDQAAHLAQLAEDTDEAKRIAERERRQADVLRIEANAREERVQAILRTMGDGLVITNARGEIEEINEAAERKFGYAADSLIGEKINKLMSADVAVRHDENIANYNLDMDTKSVRHPVEVTGRRASGDAFPLEINVTGVETSLGPVFVANMRDISERKAAERELRENNKRFSDLADNVPGVIFQWVRYADGSEGYTYVSPRSKEFLGVGPGTLGADPGLLLSWSEDPEALRDSLRKSAKAVSDWRFEGRFNLPSGKTKWLNCMAKPLPTDDGDVIYNGVYLDITRQKDLEDELRHLAAIDPLTGVMNRRAFMAAFEMERERSRRYDHPLSVLMCDIDHFKRINDTHGHGVGDDALKVFAETVRTLLRDCDGLGRIGGEEFAVLLPETGSEDAAKLAERLRKAVAGIKIPVEDDRLAFTVSIGVATMRDGEKSVTDTLDRADGALYEAKNSGRNRTVLAS